MEEKGRMRGQGELKTFRRFYEIVNMKFNKYQTELNWWTSYSLPQEVQDDLLDVLNNIVFIRRLVDPLIDLMQKTLKEIVEEEL